MALALAAHAAAPATAELVPASGDVETAAVAAIAQGQALLDEQLLPAASRVTIYVGQNQPAVLIQSLSLSIDQDAALDADFTPALSTALADSEGLRRVARTRLADGAHDAHARLVYLDRYAATPKPIELEWSGPIDKQPGELSIEIRLHRNLSGSSAKIETEQWQLLATPETWLQRAVRGIERRNSVISLFHPGDGRDPVAREARYQLALGAPEAALVELQTIARSADPRQLPLAYWLQLAQVYRAAGLLDDAAAICERLKSLGGDRHTLALERLHLAQAEFGRGNLPRAQALLLQARADVPDVQAQNWRFSYAQVLFAQNRVAEATAALGTTDSDYVEAMRYMNEPVESLRETGYNRYNLAVELLHRGERERGLSWLDLVGRSLNTDEQLLALRDKANLALGWLFLKDKQGKTALGILGRVRAEGPFSDAALLGIGWSELVPAGDTHWRSRLSYESKAKPEYVIDLPPVMRRSLMQLKVMEPELHGEFGPRTFSKDRPARSDREGLQRALQLWGMLADKSSDSPASQEAALAIGYAYDRLHDPVRAREAYLQAVQRLERAQKNLHDSAATIQAGALSTQVARARDAFDLFQALGSFGFAPASLDRPFYAALNRYRANARLLDAIDNIRTQRAAAPATTDAAGAASPTDAAAASSDDDALPARLDALKQALLAEQQVAAPQLEQTALGLLNEQQAVLKDYLKAAYFSAARLQDQRPASDSLQP